MKWTNSGKEFEQPPIGTHIARCFRLIDIGTQQGEYQGRPVFRRQVIISWELPNTHMAEGEYQGQPFMVSKYYTASLSEKANLRKDLVNWRGREFTDDELKGFESKNILGKPCMLSLTASDKGKSRVTGVMAMPQGSQCPEQINPSVHFSLERDEFNVEVFNKLSAYYQEQIKKSPEWAELNGQVEQKQKTHFEDFADDIPF